MTKDTIQITADSLRADFMNATTSWARWQVLNRALEWAVAASENAEHSRREAAELKARAEGAVMCGAVPDRMTEHDPESWGDGAYDQLFEQQDTGKP